MSHPRRSHSELTHARRSTLPRASRALFAFVASVLVLASGTARANPETVLVDMRSTGMGNTGRAHLVTPAAVTLNPANLAGIERYELSLNAPFGIGRLGAPVGGEDDVHHTPWLFVPNPAIFAAGRVADRVVIGGGLHVMSQFGGAYEDVDVLLGDMLSMPSDIEITFGTFELATAMSIRILENLDLGIGLRVPFSTLDSTQPRVLAGQTVFVEQDLKGFGPPAGRIGLTYRPVPDLALAVVYRTRSLTRMHGTVTFDSPLIVALYGGPLEVDGDMDWRLPDSLDFAVAGSLLDGRLVLAAEYSLQFFGATNEAIVFIVDDPEDGDDFESLTGSDRVVLPLEWRTTHGVRLGAEYAFNTIFRLRAGFSAMGSATSETHAQFFGSPPGYTLSEYVGAGFTAGDFEIELALGHSYGSAYIAPNAEQCQPGESVRVGCPGPYTARGILVGASVVYQR